MCGIFPAMDQWVCFGDREPSDGAPLAELWRVFPPQPSELALPAARRRVFFVYREGAARSILALSTSVIT